MVGKTSMAKHTPGHTNKSSKAKKMMKSKPMKTGKGTKKVKKITRNMF